MSCPEGMPMASSAAIEIQAAIADENDADLRPRQTHHFGDAAAG